MQNPLCFRVEEKSVFFWSTVLNLLMTFILTVKNLSLVKHDLNGTILFKLSLYVVFINYLAVCLSLCVYLYTRRLSLIKMKLVWVVRMIANGVLSLFLLISVMMAKYLMMMGNIALSTTYFLLWLALLANLAFGFINFVLFTSSFSKNRMSDLSLMSQNSGMNLRLEDYR